MPINPLGAVIIFDGENPRIITGRARTVISGGDFVVVSGAANAVSSGADSFVTTDIVLDIINNSNHVNGVALHNAGSNTNVSFATKGAYIVRSADIISGGVGVYAFSGTNQGVKSMPIDISYSGTQVGRCLTPAASGTALFTLVDFNF